MAERTLFPGKGAQHALLITLFAEKNSGDGYVHNDTLRKAMFEEDAIKKFPSVSHLKNDISGLKRSLKEIGGEFEIINRFGQGYKIIESDIETSK